MVHGGAWAIPDDLIQAHLAGIRNALDAGWRVLDELCAWAGPKRKPASKLPQTCSAWNGNPPFDAAPARHHRRPWAPQRCPVSGSLCHRPTPCSTAQPDQRGASSPIRAEGGGERFGRRG